MVEAPTPKPVDTRQYRTSWRLRFRFVAGRVDLVDRQEVQMVSPASVGPPPEAGRNSGSWVELRDSQGRMVFFRRLRDPFGTLAEHHHPEGRITVAVRPPPPAGEFEALVPAIPEARTVVLVTSALEDERSSRPAKEIARFALPGHGKDVAQ